MIVTCPNCSANITQSDSTKTVVVCKKCHTKVNLVEFLSLEVSQTNTRASGSTIASKPREYFQGELIGHFEIVKILGEGGFGCVYEAHDTRLDRRIAIKFPQMERMTASYARVFIREAQAAAQLNHPNIVSVFEIGRVDGQVFIVSELVRGTTLKEWILEEKPDPVKLSKMLAKIARALDAAHKGKVVHRDIKPRNILVDLNDEPLITDFGLAKREVHDEALVSHKNAIMGTPAYMSPEQALGKSSEADGRTDIYSLGVILYEGLLGCRPFRGETGVITDEIVRGEAETPIKMDANLPPDISAICMKAMARLPDDRFQTSLEFAEDLERFSKGLPTKTRSLGPIESVSRFVKRNLVAVTTSLVIVGLATAFFLKPTTGEVVTVSKEDETTYVEFKVDQPNAKVAIAKVDQELGSVNFEEVVVPDFDEESGYFSADLTKGIYVVEASVEGVGIQEVRRSVGDNEINQFEGHNSTTWKPTKNGIRWPIVSITSIAHAEKIELDKGVTVEGMELLLVKDSKFTQTIRGRKVEFEVPSFLLGRHEVTAREYLESVGSLPLPMLKEFGKRNPAASASRRIVAADIPGDTVVTHVAYWDVLRYCEITGTRPMLFEEYLAVATNFGNSKFPWGNSELNDWDKNWGHNAVELPMPNVIFDPRFEGFFSSYLEWTQEFQMPLDPTTGKPCGIRILGRNNADARHVVDGPGELLHEYPIDEKVVLAPVAYTDTLIDTHSPNLGFRVARSLKPRIIKKAKPAE